MDAELSFSVITEDDGDKEQIIHPFFHRHPLKLLPLVPKDCESCNICGIGIIREQVWGCPERRCSYYAHKPCLHSLPEIVQLKHGSQVASWSLFSPRYDGACIDCHRSVDSCPRFRRNGDSGEYLCFTCCLVRKLIGDDDESSLQIPKVIHHFFHPCALELRFSPSTTCNACFLNHSHLSYYCKDCHFFLDFKCARLPKVSHLDDDSNQIHHFCHWHPLQHFPDEATDGETLCQLCESCSSSSSTTFDPFYGCTECQFYAHKSCIDVLPQKIIQPVFDETVVLLTVPSYVCTTCDRACSGLTFYSKGYDFCVKCTLQSRNEFGLFKSIHHQHLLRTREIDEADETGCLLCGRECSGRHCECKKCSTYFHESCLELPRELKHPIHPQHPLTLTFFESVSAKCKLCLRDVGSVCYNWDSVFLDHGCAYLLPSIQYQGHLLWVVDNLSHDQAPCDRCHETLPTDSPVLRCPECYFDLHLECGPLPCRIKDPRHVHPLTFQEYYVEDNDMSDLFACHICEKKREARRPVYLCKDGCFITCEVKCVLREVVASLRGERGVMELDTVYPKVACKMITTDSCLEGITCGSSSRENVATDVHVFSFEELIQRVDFDFDSGLLEEGSNKLNPGISDLGGDSSSRSDYDVGEYPYSRKDFMHYIKNFEGIYYDRDDLRKIFTKHDGWCTGGDYLLPNTLHSVYNNFFEEHDIFGPGCDLSHDDRRVIVFFICSVLHDMRMIKVLDVSADRISMWSFTLKTVQAHYKNDGLQLDFLFKYLIRIAEDHYLVQSVDIIETTFSKLSMEKEELSAREERLIRKLAETRSNMEDNKERLKSFRAYRYAGAHELKKEYYASLENKWRPCYEF